MLLKLKLRDHLGPLTNCVPSTDTREHPNAYLAFAFGVLAMWIGDIVRLWNSSDAALWHQLNLASAIVLIGLAFIIGVAVAPLGQENWTYRAKLSVSEHDSTMPEIVSICAELGGDINMGWSCDLSCTGGDCW